MQSQYTSVNTAIFARLSLVGWFLRPPFAEDVHDVSYAVGEWFLFDVQSVLHAPERLLVTLYYHVFFSYH